MDGSEPGDTVPAAVLSGAPTDLQARTVRYGCNLRKSISDANYAIQNLPPLEARHAIRYLAPAPLADGLGCVAEGPPLGKPSDGLAIVC